MDKLKNFWWKCVDLILNAQPLLATAIYFSFLLGTPPLWLSWALALIPWPLRFWRTGRFTRRTIFDIPILIFLIGLIAVLLISTRSNLSYEAFNTYLACVLIYYGLVNNTKCGKWYWIILGLVIIAVLLLVCAYVFMRGDVRIYFFNQWFYDLIHQVKISGSIIASYNVIGFATIISIPVLLALILFGNNLPVRILSSFFCLVFVFILVIAGSGGSWLCIVPGLILLLFFWRYWSPAVTITISACLFWVGLIYWQKITVLSQLIPAQSVSSRLSLWENTLSILKDNFLWGCGLAGWQQMYMDHGFHSHLNVHNSYLQLYSDTGLMGGIAIIAAFACLICLFFRNFKLRQNSNWYALALGLTVAIIVGAVHAFVEVTTSAIISQQNMVMHYLGIPAIWIWSALLVVAHDHVEATSNKNAEDHSA